MQSTKSAGYAANPYACRWAGAVAKDRGAIRRVNAEKVKMCPPHGPTKRGKDVPKINKAGYTGQDGAPSVIYS